MVLQNILIICFRCELVDHKTESYPSTKESASSLRENTKGLVEKQGKKIDS